MDAVKFIKESKRLCKAQESCGKCVAQIGGCCLTDICVEENSAEKAVAVVEQWSKDHPAKTRQSEFLKVFPKAEIKDDALWMCPKYISYDYRPEENCYKISCSDCKHKFWLAEVTDND